MGSIDAAVYLYRVIERANRIDLQRGPPARGSYKGAGPLVEIGEAGFKTELMSGYPFFLIDHPLYSE